MPRPAACRCASHSSRHTSTSKQLLLFLLLICACFLLCCYVLVISTRSTIRHSEARSDSVRHSADHLVVIHRRALSLEAKRSKDLQRISATVTKQLHLCGSRNHRSKKKKKKKSNHVAFFLRCVSSKAVVMPHNFYLHSSLVQSRVTKRTEKALRQALCYNVVDTAVALNVAFFVNSSILIGNSSKRERERVS